MSRVEHLERQKTRKARDKARRAERGHKDERTHALLLSQSGEATAEAVVAADAGVTVVDMPRPVLHGLRSACRDPTTPLWRDRALAFAAARHPRLGAESSARQLPRDVFRLIMSMVERELLVVVGGLAESKGKDKNRHAQLDDNNNGGDASDDDGGEWDHRSRFVACNNVRVLEHKLPYRWRDLPPLPIVVSVVALCLLHSFTPTSDCPICRHRIAKRSFVA